MSQVPVSMIVVSIAPLSLEIDGPQAGLVGEFYSFSAAVSPISTTLPLEYTWQASRQETVTHSGGLSDMLALIWDSPGTQAITVTATNFGGTVTDVHTITISEVAISGLVAGSNSPTLLGTPTTFTATVEEGTNVTYAWGFGDDTAGLGAMLAHTYAATGFYTVTVTASNSVGSIQTSTVVTIIDVHITGLIAISDSPTLMGIPTTFTATVTAYNSVGNMQASTLVEVVIPETKVYMPAVLQAYPSSPDAIFWRQQE